MIRTSWRRNAGSRRNKKHKTVGYHLKESKGHADKVAACYQATHNFFKQVACAIDHDFRSKPAHEARTAKISDCYPLADQQNLIPWKKDGVVVKLPRKEKVRGSGRP